MTIVALVTVAALAAAAVTKPASPAQPPKSAKSSKPAATSTRPAAPSPGAPTATADPVRDAYARATAPALGDSSRIRLAAFIAHSSRHPLAREAWLELGTLAYALGEYAEARDDFRRARGGAVIDRARLWEARALLALGAPRDARALVQSMAHARQPSAQRWEAGEIVALSFTNEGKRANALSAYRALLDEPASVGEAAALFQAIELADESGNAADSRAWRERLERAYPRSPEAASLRAEATSPIAPSGGDRDDNDARGARTKS